MKANLIIQISEITIRDYNVVEEQGLIRLLANSGGGLSIAYEEENDAWEEAVKNVFVIKGTSLEALLKFLSLSEIVVTVIA